MVEVHGDETQRDADDATSRLMLPGREARLQELALRTLILLGAVGAPLVGAAEVLRAMREGTEAEVLHVLFSLERRHLVVCDHRLETRFGIARSRYGEVLEILDIAGL